MKKRDYRAEYRRKKELRKQAKIEATKHFKIAKDALWAVITGYRQSHQLWADDVQRANECIKMAFRKDDRVFEEANILLRKYKSFDRVD